MSPVPRELIHKSEMTRNVSDKRFAQIHIVGIYYVYTFFKEWFMQAYPKWGNSLGYGYQKQ